MECCRMESLERPPRKKKKEDQVAKGPVMYAYDGRKVEVQAKTESAGLCHVLDLRNRISLQQERRKPATLPNHGNRNSRSACASTRV